MKRLLFVWVLGFSTIAMAGFTRTNGVVTDSVTTLEWQDDYSNSAGAIPQSNWEDAIDYCEALTLDGGGWRLPNVRELKSIVNYTITNPSIDSTFTNTQSIFYWSSTTYTGSPSNAYFVHFYNGYQDNYDKSDSSYIRCVRAGQ